MLRHKTNYDWKEEISISLDYGCKITLFIRSSSIYQSNTTESEILFKLDIHHYSYEKKGKCYFANQLIHFLDNEDCNVKGIYAPLTPVSWFNMLPIGFFHSDKLCSSHKSKRC